MYFVFLASLWMTNVSVNFFFKVKVFIEHISHGIEKHIVSVYYHIRHGIGKHAVRVCTTYYWHLHIAVRRCTHACMHYSSVYGDGSSILFLPLFSLLRLLVTFRLIIIVI